MNIYGIDEHKNMVGSKTFSANFRYVSGPDIGYYAYDFDYSDLLNNDSFFRNIRISISGKFEFFNLSNMNSPTSMMTDFVYHHFNEDGSLYLMKFGNNAFMRIQKLNSSGVIIVLPSSGLFDDSVDVMLYR